MAVVAGPSWLLLMLLSAGMPLNLPLSLPPLPEDTALASMAPPECVWYMALSGVDKANAASKNKTEQLLAEDDVQRFFHDLSARLKKSFAKSGVNDPKGKVVAEEGPKIVETLLTRPASIYVQVGAMGPNRPDIHAGLVVNLGDDVAATKASLEKLEQTLLSGQPMPPQVPISGVGDGAKASAWHSLPMPPGAPPIQWAIKEKYLIVGIGNGEADAMLARKGKPAPEWLTKLRSALKVERPAMVSFLNLESILRLASTLNVAPPGQDNPFAKFVQIAGLQNVKSYANVSGLDQDTYASRSLLTIDGQPQGLFTLIGQQPLKLDALNSIPADASFAVAAKLDAGKVFDMLKNDAVMIHPEAQQEIEQGLSKFNQMLGMNFKTDLLDVLGDTWTVFNSPGNGGLVFTGLTATVDLRDRTRVLKAEEKLMALVSQMTPQPVFGNGGAQFDDSVRIAPPPKIESFDFLGQKIHFVNFVGTTSPVAPAWCITEKQVVFGLFPQTIKAYLQRQSASGSAKQSLASLPEVAKQFSPSAPAIFGYQDTPNNFKLAYPIVEVLAQLACSELQRQGIDLDISMLPNARAILPHLTDNVSTVQSTKDGILIESRGTLPMGTGALPLATVPFLFAVRSTQIPTPVPAMPPTFTPPVSGAAPSPAIFSGSIGIAVLPGAAERVKSINNMKQLVLAMLNFESAKKSFPPGFQADKNGKPLLSWRVLLLPFLEQKDLFDQFKLDEPWDSENNKKLIDKMPDIYKVPGSKVAGEFKTVYLTPRGETTAFPGAKGIRFREIPDGTSKTLALVEASDDKAVVWTKPDDFDVDEKNPIAGLVGLRDGLFLAAFCDGSVRPLSANLDAETLRRLFRRNDGKVVDEDALNMPPRPTPTTMPVPTTAPMPVPLQPPMPAQAPFAPQPVLPQPVQPMR
ncbi:MAG TPA: DUF1559 domain-containing protein [Pirellulales bacterium]